MDPNINPETAVELDPIKLQAAQREAQKVLEAQRAEEAQAAFEKWENESQKAFKGIYSRPLRRMMLRNALRKMEREQEAGE